MIFRLISTYNSFGHICLRLDTSLPASFPWNYSKPPPSHFFGTKTHTHTQKQHVFLKPGGGGRWYKPSYQDHPPKKTSPIHGVFPGDRCFPSSRKLVLQGESDSPGQRVEGELILYFHPSTFRIRMNQLQFFVWWWIVWMDGGWFLKNQGPMFLEVFLGRLVEVGVLIIFLLYCQFIVILVCFCGRLDWDRERLFCFPPSAEDDYLSTSSQQVASHVGFFSENWQWKLSRDITFVTILFSKNTYFFIYSP